MSAYIVDQHHITYLVFAGSAYGVNRRQINRDGDLASDAEIGQMLLSENVKSVAYRYPDTEESELPGPVGYSEIYRHNPRATWLNLNPVQVLKSCDCLAYQSCEHPEWETSKAYHYLETLKSAAYHRMPEYESAKWGAPEPDPHAVRLSALI